MSEFCDAPLISFLPTSKRMTMRHGPIDLIVQAEGRFPAETRDAYAAAANEFPNILPNLCNELPLLRKQLTRKNAQPNGAVAQRMFGAAERFCQNHFVTPMIAVAGSVADHVLESMLLANSSEESSLQKAFVNNGGDIALHLQGDAIFEVGICSDIVTGEICSKAKISASDGIGGIATSGWQGRSHSFGIADAVTVFAANAAIADAAATLIANAVNLDEDSPYVERIAASELLPDSDLGDRLVTVGVASLPATERLTALENGKALANQLVRDGLIHSVYLSLQGDNLLALGKSGGEASHFTTRLENMKLEAVPQYA